ESPWDRASPLHATGSAVVLDPVGRRLLLRWHERQQAWLQVGGHADPGEDEPFAVALREAREETGLVDLVPWPDGDRAELVHLVIVPVPEGKGEPAHEHADLRYLLATSTPDAARPESPTAPMQWLTFEEAYALTAEDNLRETLRRAEEHLGRQ
ncbi:MAG TPA: NUDIX domain-containing protein, partial [Acidimicrobiales bacterium]|nr:NUDIX domain-containing protein [Acidimicrobiales bacterium]